MEKGEVNREAAGALVTKKKKQMMGEAPELGAGATDQTESRVSSPRPP